MYIYCPNITTLKKLIAIVFLGIYLFNLVGYQGVFVFLGNTISTSIVTQLDRGEYNDAELVEIKISYPMLYTPDWPEYKRFDGEVEMNGIHYNYVKRKLSNDTLYLLCIPNRDKTKLATAKLNYLGNSNDATNSSNNKKTPASGSVQKVFGQDYCNLIPDFNALTAAILIKRSYPLLQSALCNAYTSDLLQPPRI